jgi:hypothetical protein
MTELSPFSPAAIKEMPIKIKEGQRGTCSRRKFGRRLNLRLQ